MPLFEGSEVETRQPDVAGLSRSRFDNSMPPTMRCSRIADVTFTRAYGYVSARYVTMVGRRWSASSGDPHTFVQVEL